jgi:hypothetical protein
MLKRYRFWLVLAIVLLFLNTLVHGATLFLQPAPEDETQRQLIELMTTYKYDFGAGFKRSTKELVTALSSCFSLLSLLGAATLSYLMRRRPEAELLKGVVAIHAFVFGICFAIMAAFTFLPPIILTGLIFISLSIAFFLIPRQEAANS